MVKSFLRYLINKIRFPRLHLKMGTALKGNLKYKEKCIIGSHCYISNTVFDHNVNVENYVYLNNVVLGENVRIFNGCHLYNVAVARYTYISPNSIISHANIGTFCSIGRNIHCIGANHPIDFLSTHPVFYSTHKQCGKSFTDSELFDEFLQIEIGNDVWIGSNAVILGGIKVNNGAIIGAGSVVTKDVSPYSIVGGNPAKHLRFRFDECTIKQIQDLTWWDWDDDTILRNIKKFQSSYSNTK